MSVFSYLTELRNDSWFRKKYDVKLWNDYEIRERRGTTLVIFGSSKAELIVVEVGS